jgi:hypothetical protein
MSVETHHPVKSCVRAPKEIPATPPRLWTGRAKAQELRRFLCNASNSTIRA